MIHKKNVRKDIIYADEVYEIIGMMYEVYDTIGYGHKERFYQKAVVEIFIKHKKKFQEQLRAKVAIQGKEVGLCILDFLYEEKIVIELKQGEVFSRKNIKQVYFYLKATDLRAC